MANTHFLNFWMVKYWWTYFCKLFGCKTQDIWRVKIWWIATNLPNLPIFSPSKYFPRTVYQWNSPRNMSNSLLSPYHWSYALLQHVYHGNFQSPIHILVKTITDYGFYSKTQFAVTCFLTHGKYAKFVVLRTWLAI